MSKRSQTAMNMLMIASLPIKTNYIPMKILYYIAFTFCLLQVILWLFGPFAGPLTIAHYIKIGLWAGIPPEVITNKLGIQLQTFKTISSSVAVIYFVCIFSCVILPLLYKVKNTLKYKIGSILGLIIVIILFVGRLLVIM